MNIPPAATLPPYPMDGSVPFRSHLLGFSSLPLLCIYRAAAVDRRPEVMNRPGASAAMAGCVRNGRDIKNGKGKQKSKRYDTE